MAVPTATLRHRVVSVTPPPRAQRLFLLLREVFHLRLRELDVVDIGFGGGILDDRSPTV
jgi:hypothetical protein